MTATLSPAYITRDSDHGRVETRTVRTSTLLNNYLCFPHVAQVFTIKRQRTDLKGRFMSEETAYCVTSLAPDRANPARLLDLSRSHWEIENRLHWVRDVTLDEDRSQIRTKSGPRVFATLRNLIIGVLRLSGCTNIASGLRNLSWGKPEPVLSLLGC